MIIEVLLSPTDFWWWIIIGLILMTMEMLVPGAFFLWIGLSALINGAIVWIFPMTSLAFQLFIFAVMAPIVTWAGRKYFKMSQKSDAPLLNLRVKQLIGKKIVLSHPIVDGQAQIIVGDSVWKAEGPDLPAGSHVVIVDVRGNVLVVKPEKNN